MPQANPVRCSCRLNKPFGEGKGGKKKKNNILGPTLNLLAAKLNGFEFGSPHMNWTSS